MIRPDECRQLSDTDVVKCSPQRLAERHGISQKDINYAIDGYADDMLSDLVYSVERDLEHQRKRVARLDPLCRRVPEVGVSRPLRGRNPR
jgi:hypothetical protein